MREKQLQMQKSKYLAIKTLRAQQKKKGAIETLNQQLKRKEKQISILKKQLKSHETISKLKDQCKVKARSQKRLKKSLTDMKKEVRSNSVDVERYCELEESINSMNCEIHDLQVENL